MSNTTSPAGLERFVAAQAPVWTTVQAELAAGRKRSHWMWFVFPQLKGLGRSDMAQFYGIDSLTEARAYLSHALLGERLRQCVRSLLALNSGNAHDIFGFPDELKLQSCLSLFAQVASPGEPLFDEALNRYFDGMADAKTLSLLQRG